MKKRTYKVSWSGYFVTLSSFSERGDSRREPLGEILDRINSIHRHTEHEVFFILDGEMELVTESGSARYSDAAVIVPAGEDHYTVADSNKLLVLYMSAENKKTERLLGEKLKDIFSFNLNSDERFYVDGIGRTRSDEERFHLMSLLFSSVVRRISPDENLLNEDAVGTGKYSFDIDAFIEQNFSKSVRLSELAKYLHLCEKQVSRVIKKEYNCSFPNLIQRKRLSVASMMLKHTDMTVCEIAQKVGFANNNYFYRVFKEEYGETPIKYREKQKNGS